MPKAPLFNMKGEKIGEVDLREDLFGAPVNEAVLHRAIVLQLASRRLGTHKTKTIGEVSGGGRKPYRQKGTGRARQGSIRSPLWPGGATLFGPQPREYGFSIPKKERRLAIRSALSAKALKDGVLVIDDLTMDVPKTKVMAELLSKINAGKTTFVARAEEENAAKSARNIDGVRVLDADKINVYDVLDCDHLVLSKAALARVEEVLA